MNRDTLHIAIMVRAFVPGGAENMVLHLCNYLWRNGPELNIKCSLLVVQPSRQSLVKHANEMDTHIFPVWSPLFPLGVYKLRRWITKNKPQIVHAHLPFCGIISALFFAQQRNGVFSMYSEHSRYRGRIDFWLHGWLYRRHNYIHFVSSFVAQSIGSQQRKNYYCNPNSIVIDNAVPVQPYVRLKIAESSRRVITIGTLCIFRNVKNLPAMVAIMAELNAKFKGHLNFVIGGDGPSRNEVEAAIRENNLQSLVELPGLITDVPAFLARIDVFMMTSLYEGLPLALLEAMQQGCLPALMRNGSTDHLPIEEFGLHFNPDNVEQLTRFIEKLLHMEAEELRKMHNSSRAFVTTHYNPEAHYASMVNLYRKVAGNSVCN